MNGVGIGWICQITRAGRTRHRVGCKRGAYLKNCRGGPTCPYGYGSFLLDPPFRCIQRCTKAEWVRRLTAFAKVDLAVSFS